LIRQPILVVLGHVDSGKTLLLDKIRNTAVHAREAGGMTQHIGASMFPAETLREICGPLLSKYGFRIQIPGLLVIDTPGHEIFSNLRTRGGSAADLSILVVDAIKGVEAQTVESLEILRERKVPFVVALNKIDLIPGWNSQKTNSVLESMEKQSREVIERLDRCVYSVCGKLSQLGFRSELFTRVKSFVKEVSIVPISAKTGEGIAEILALVVGLTQQYMKKRLTVEPGKSYGIVLEVKEEPGVGPVADLILINGSITVGDDLVMVTREGSIKAHVRGLLMPKPLDEMRDPKDKFTPVGEVGAAAGVRLLSADVKKVLAGTRFVKITDPSTFESASSQLYEELKAVIVSTEQTGLVVKADALGTLEALVSFLNRKNVLVRIADVGPLTRREVIEATTVAKEDPLLGVVLIFRVGLLPEAEEEVRSRRVKVFTDEVLYNLLENYLRWSEEERERMAYARFMALPRPVKIQILKDYIFRRSNPAIFGVKVLIGTLKEKASLMNSEGKAVGVVQQIQDRRRAIPMAEAGSEVAISIQGPVIGRTVKDDEVLYSDLKFEEAKTLLSEFRDRLSESELEALEEVREVKRRTDPSWALV